MLRFLRLSLEFIAAFIGVMILAALLLIWRLESKPMSSTFLTPYVESGLNHIAPNTHIQIAHTILTWNNGDRSISFHADGVKVSDPHGQVIAELPNLDVELSVFGLLLGQFIPKTLIVDHPQIQLERQIDGRLNFGVTTQTQDDDTSNVRDIATRIVDSLAHAYITNKLVVSRVVLNIKDAATQKSWAVSIPKITLEHSGKGLIGEALLDVTQEDQTSTIDLHYNYDEKRETHTIATHFSNITPSFFAGKNPATVGLSPAAIFDVPLSGKMAVAFDNDLTLEAASADIHGDQGRLQAPQLWTQPRPIKSLDIKIGYDRPSGQLDIPLATIDFGGPQLGLSIQGTATSPVADQFDFDLSVQLDNWPLDQFDRLWPKPFIPNARDWIVSSISKGSFDHAQAHLKGSLPLNNPDNATVTAGDGKISASGAQISYLDGMPPVKGVNADGTFDLQHMEIHVTSGATDAIKIMPSTIRMTDLDKDTQYIDIPLNISGPIPDVLKLLDSPPLQYAKALGISPGDITGKVDGQVNLHFPLLKALMLKDMDIAANANIANMSSSRLVPGIDITQGNLALALNKSGVNFKGPAALNKVPMQINWQQNFTASKDQPLGQGNVSGLISGEQWALLGLDALNGSKGSIATNLNITQPTKAETILVGTLDMGAAEVHVDQLNWKKPSGIPALLKFSVDMPSGQDILIKSIDLHGPQLAVKGTASLSADGNHLVALDLKPMMIGRTNATLHFTEDDDGDLLFKAEGASLDVTGLKGGKEPAHSDPHAKGFQIKVDKLYTSPNGFMSNAEGFAVRDPDGWLKINLHGLAGGEHAIDISLLPLDNHKIFNLTCDDFGEALKGLGFTDTVREGNLQIHGESTDENPRIIDGDVKISAFTVRNLPVLALLLNATSPFGFTDILTDRASFDHLVGKFRWQGDAIDLMQTRAAGSAVGINVDGKVDMNTGAANLHGTLVPFSMVNHALNYIPLIGDVLTGGEGQGVLAVAYKISGALGDPKISVNPTSLLTPGFIRNLFFGDEE